MSSCTPESTCNPSRDNPDQAPAQPWDDPPIVVLGIGNVLWADEGFGVRCVEALQQRWQLPSTVQLVDGGTQGLYLIQHVQSARQLLIFDAIDYGLPPGTLHLVENEEVPRFLGAKKMSLHQTGFQEVLMLAQLTGRYPEQVLLIGCQPEELEDYGGSLRPSVRAALDQAVALAVTRLAQWGAVAQARQDHVSTDEAVTASMLSLQAYEAGRPSAEAACRVGDARFMPTEATALPTTTPTPQEV